MTKKIDSRLQTILTSPYVRPQLHHAGLINSRGHLIARHQSLHGVPSQVHQRRQEQTITTEAVFRVLKDDEHRRRSRYHQLAIASRRASLNHLEFEKILDRRHRKQSLGSDKSRDRSVSTHATTKQNRNERQPRVTSAHSITSSDESDWSEIERILQGTNQVSRSDTLDRSNAAAGKQCPCEITMSYGSPATVHSTRSARHEVIVVQQHSTGENLVVYRGFLTKGESFAFQSQRRSTSPLALAFYTKGYIDSVVNDCCEYKYGRRRRGAHEHAQFLVEQIRHASPCEKCRDRHSQRLLTAASTANNTPSNTREEPLSHQTRRCDPIPVLTGKSKVDNPDGDLIERDTHRYKKKAQYKRPSITTYTSDDYDKDDKRMEWRRSVTTDRSESANFGLLELALTDEAESETQITLTKTVHPLVVQANTTSPRAESIQENTSPSPPQDPDIPEWTEQTNNDQRSLDIVGTTSVESSPQESAPVSPHPPSIYRERSPSSVENFVYILDGTIQISGDEHRKLRGLINSGWVLSDTNVSVCIERIAQTVHEKIIMISSRATLRNLEQHVQGISQLLYVYVVDNTKDRSYDFERIRGIYKSLGKVCKQLEKDLVPFTNDLMPILPVSLKDISESTFPYIQVLKDILAETDETTDARKEMLDYCRQMYAENETQLKFIDEFEQHFRSDQAANWYTRQETFLFKMLTRAFRMFDPPLLFKLRFFIQHLYQQMESNRSVQAMTVYRAQYISNDVLETISETCGGLVTFAPFLVAQKTKRVSQQQRPERPFVNSSVTLVLFQMKLKASASMTPVDRNDDEILLPAATVFLISAVKRKDGTMPVVKLTFNNDVLSATHEATANLRHAVQDSFPLLRLAKLMKQKEDVRSMEYFCNILVDHPLTADDPVVIMTVGSLLHTLCSLYYETNQYDLALEQLQKSLSVYLRVLSPHDIKLTPTYNNMGSIYHKQGLSDYALHFHRKAYDIQVLSTHVDLVSIAAYAGNVASVLVQQGKYEEAIPYLQRDLQIRQRLHPDGNNIELSTKYHNLAGALFRVNQHKRALENYRKCLDIEQRLRPANHPTVAVTYYNMATVQEALGRLDSAIESMDKAIERLLLTRNHDDDSVRFYREYKEYLQEGM